MANKLPIFILLLKTVWKEAHKKEHCRKSLLTRFWPPETMPVHYEKDQIWQERNFFDANIVETI
jgi:hypothetical protein